MRLISNRLNCGLVLKTQFKSISTGWMIQFHWRKKTATSNRLSFNLTTIILEIQSHCQTISINLVIIWCARIQKHHIHECSALKCKHNIILWNRRLPITWNVLSWYKLCSYQISNKATTYFVSLSFMKAIYYFIRFMWSKQYVLYTAIEWQ